MFILFTGHRDRWAKEMDLDFISAKYPDAVWVHGGAKGFDTQVEYYAKETGMQTIIVPPAYKKYSPSYLAPLKRNDLMLSMCSLVVALYDGRKKGGTYYTINQAKKLGKEIIIITPA